MSAAGAAEAEVHAWTTARLAARPPTPMDASAVLALHGDPRTSAGTSIRTSLLASHRETAPRGPCDLHCRRLRSGYWSRCRPP